MKIGISKMVMIVDIRKVEKRIMIKKVKGFRVQRSGLKTLTKGTFKEKVDSLIS
jgi:hypothetical protein